MDTNEERPTHQSDAPKQPEPPFVPSPLPSAEQHAALAAQLLAPLGKGGEIPNAAILDAVANAARLWAAVLAYPTEDAVETARLKMAPFQSRPDAERRWRQWTDCKRTADEMAGDDKDMLKRARWRERADAAFSDLKFPAAFDDVLAAIDDGGSVIGAAKGSRRRRFGNHWLAWATRLERARWEREFMAPQRIPGEGDILRAEAEKRIERQRAGLPPEPSDFEGPGGRERLTAEVARAQAQHTARAGEAWTARERDLHAALKKFSDEPIEMQLAVEFFRIFREGDARSVRVKGGRNRQAKRKEGPRKKNGAS